MTFYHIEGKCNGLSDPSLNYVRQGITYMANGRLVKTWWLQLVRK